MAGLTTVVQNNGLWKVHGSYASGTQDYGLVTIGY